MQGASAHQLKQLVGAHLIDSDEQLHGLLQLLREQLDHLQVWRRAVLCLPMDKPRTHSLTHSLRLRPSRTHQRVALPPLLRAGAGSGRMDCDACLAFGFRCT